MRQYCIVIYFAGKTFTPGFLSNVAKILRRIEETKAVFRNIPNEDIQNARLVTEFTLKHVNPKKHLGDFCVTIPDLDVQASNYKGGVCPESKCTYYFFLSHLVTLVRSSLCMMRLL